MRSNLNQILMVEDDTWSQDERTPPMIPKNPEVLNSIRGQLLVAMPQMEDKRFRQSVILMC